MRRWIERRRRPVIGVDLGASAVKAVGLDCRHSPPRLAGFSVEPLEMPAIRDGEITDPDGLAPALRRAVQRISPRAREVALAIPASGAITRRLTVPAGLDEPAIIGRVALAVDDLLPLPRHTVYYDFRPAAQPRAGSDGLSVTLTATRREMIDQRTALLRQARLRPVLIDVEDQVLARLADPGPAAEDGAVIGLMDIGHQGLRFSVMTGGEPLHRQSRALPPDASQNGLIIEAERALAVYQGSPDARALTHLQVTGGRIDAAGAEALGQTLGLPAVRPAPLERLPPWSAVDTVGLEHAAGRLGTALGLALHAGDPHAHWR